ncbi:DUF882 domain-containing protein [Vibrio sp. TH_r3]|uniref:DUF882 domain-containing protein n=1 Tax=Vibrio sp. TH_r3 TaxID=3082084 RepID=UPI002952AE19|nr:DUF882 domain-containing protein [Vibrio sp. TH_r3]MDV7102843.1 DUF882 domain-containing protein [Vibrio sp. TH_r3]
MSFTKNDRREFLKRVSGTAAFAVCIPSSAFASLISDNKSTTKQTQLNQVLHNNGEMRFNNLHTGEVLNTVISANKTITTSEFSKINHICRDFRKNEIYQMDEQLILQLHNIQSVLKTDAEIQIISGYRSPATNEALRSKSNNSGVAKKSFHMLGKAMDFRLEGVRLSDVRDAARGLAMGGVGYYPNSNFVHIDTGPVRTW